MKNMLTVSALLTSLLLVACASAPAPPAALVQARSTVRMVELDPDVLAQAPLELQRSTTSLERANTLLSQGASEADVSSAAYVASQQAKTAVAIARAKNNEAAIACAEVERERTRADIRTVEAQRAQASASSARAQANDARAQTAVAQVRASDAEQQAAVAQSSASEAQQQAAQLQQQLNELQAQRTERGLLVTLGDVLFEFNRAEVRSSAQASLHKLAEFLQRHPARLVLIEGHTDNVGDAAYNEGLSRRRAEAVSSALVAMGVAAQRVSTVGYGMSFPVDANTTDTSRALNRRVEVYISDNDRPVRLRR